MTARLTPLPLSRPCSEVGPGAAVPPAPLSLLPGVGAPHRGAGGARRMASSPDGEGQEPDSSREGRGSHDKARQGQHAARICPVLRLEPCEAAQPAEYETSACQGRPPRQCCSIPGQHRGPWGRHGDGHVRRVVVLLSKGSLSYERGPAPESPMRPGWATGRSGMRRRRCLLLDASSHAVTRGTYGPAHRGGAPFSVTT
jgi:hypothetical protein